MLLVILQLIINLVGDIVTLVDGVSGTTVIND